MTASSSAALRSRVRGKRNASYRGSTRSRGGLGRRSCRGHRGRGPPAAPPGGDYIVKARFQNAAQLVKGNLVQTGGAPIGTVKTIDLTDDGQAEVTMKLQDDYAPLRRGTLATIRQASLSGVANRYIDLRMAPAERREDPRRRRPRAGRDDHGRRPRPALQHLRPADAQGALRRHPRLRGAGQGPGQAVQRGHRLPQPVARRLEPAVPRAQPRHAAAGALHRLLVAARRRTSPTAATTSPASSTSSPPRRPRSATRRRRWPSRSAASPASSAARTRRSSTCAPRSTTSTRSSRTPSPSPRSCARSSPSCGRWPATRGRRSTTSRTSSSGPAPPTT